MPSSTRMSIIAAAGLAATVAASVRAQISTFTGGSPIDPINWCDPLNWFPADIPADGNTINVPGGELANMAGCSGSLMRILGPINASGTIRFYTPVTFAGGGTVNNPVFEFSTTPVPVGGALAITGPNAIWQGGIFSGGALHNSGSLLVERSFISGRTSPRELTNGCEFTNAGTMRLRQGFKINDTSVYRNEGVLTCEQSCTIGRDNGTGTLYNESQIDVPAGQSLSLTCGLFSTRQLHSEGTLTVQAEATVQGMDVAGGGTIRFLAFQNQPVVLAAAQYSGEGNIQLSDGLFQFGNVSARVTGPNGRGLWFATPRSIDVSNGRISVSGESSHPGLLTWSGGTINGMNGNRQFPHIDIYDGGQLNIVSSPGFSGGGDAVGVYFSIGAYVYQSATARLLSGSRMMVHLGGSYVLSHTTLSGDGTNLLDIAGRLEVNPPFDTSGATAFLNGVNTHLGGTSVTVVHRNDFITSSSPIELDGTALVYIERGARWRALGPTNAGNGTPQITGEGIFELGTGQFLTLSGGTLALNTSNDPAYGFKQFGTVRGQGDPGHIENNGAWEWRSGAIDFPNGQTGVYNNGLFIADCGSCQLRSDFTNNDLVRVLDTLVLAVPGVEFNNDADIELYGNITDPTSAHEGVLSNEGEIVKLGTNFSQISTTFDNWGTLRVSEGTLALLSPILQYANGTLSGGNWIVESAATLSTPGIAINVVDADVTIEYGGSWPQFLPRENHGSISISRIYNAPAGFENLSELNIASSAAMIMSPNYGFRQISGRTSVHAGAQLSSQLPVLINGGVLGGTGTVAAPVVNSGGTVSPGLSPGTLTINGPFNQSQGGGTLEIELAGPAQALRDLLVVNGPATLGGTLRVSLLDGYSPALGDTFTILTAASIQGDFATIVPPATGLPSGVNLSVVRTATSIALRITCPADFNADSAVDFFDYLDFVQAFAESSLLADFNDDSVIDFFDYLDFVSAFSGGC